MFFTINAYKFLLGSEDIYRLCKDNTWKQQSNFVPFDPDTDMLFESFTSADRWLQSNNPIFVNGEIVDLNEEVSDLFDDKYNFEIIAHRISKPSNPIFTREQLRNVLINGNDSHSNSLVIDYDGNPKLVPLINRSAINVTEYPVRVEIFQVGNGYVGSQASLSHLDGTYLTLLEAWEMHIDTGRSFYHDYVSGELTEEQLKTKIIKVVNNLK